MGLVEALRAGHPDLMVEGGVVRPGWVSVLAEREAVLELAGALRDEFGFTHPISAGAVDLAKDDRIRMIYYLMNPASRVVLTLRVDLPRGEPTMPTLTGIWEAMSFHERETTEMFGVKFEGHPNPAPLLLPPDWRGGYPLRKDFKGEGAQ